MRNIIGQPIVGDDLFGRAFELSELWRRLEHGEHVLMLAPRRVGKTSMMLELCNAPRDGWDVVYVNVEAAEGPADCMAAIVAELAGVEGYRGRVGRFRAANAARNVSRRIARVGFHGFRAELGASMRRGWRDTAALFIGLLQALTGDGRRLLVVIDELPYAILRMLRGDGGRDETELFLSWLRSWRQSPSLRGWAAMLLGGSIGLEGVLRRERLSGVINDLAPFPVSSWKRETAGAFLDALARDCEFPLSRDSIRGMLDALRDPVPGHVQLFFHELRTSCGADASRVAADTIDRCFERRLCGPDGKAHLDHYTERLDFAFEGAERELVDEILGRACRSADGAGLAAFDDVRRANDAAFRSVRRELEAAGYLDPDHDRVAFRSNLLRTWWRTQRGAGGAP